MDTVVIETKEYDVNLGGWIVNGLSAIANVTRRGPEFILLPSTATDLELETAILAAYQP